MKRLKRIISYDGVSSEEFGVDLTAIGSFTGPDRDVEAIDIPGRDGTLIIDNGRYQNISISYGCKIWRKRSNEFREAFSAFADFLLSRQNGYYRLEDDADPDHFRMARVTGGIDPSVTEAWDGPVAAEFDITFDCKPQRFLKSGEEALQIASGSVLYNPTTHDAAPLIRIYGTGSVTINDVTITIASGADSFIDLDCYNHHAVEGTVNRSSLVTLDEWPALVPGINQISYDSTITDVNITPNWWCL